ncbi:thioredoxin TrxC [Novosphingobium sp.]|uniref:thioredoxin TrxC n=1 Tax=Novosphingobium sp. TaxID=1874826 RepID=UPI002B4A99B9|nr:thioredoxin TrxC [Novosphingobium sp.]HKR92188.1 thioredoxin TrxC [Novosphingobium sp.]
MADPVIIACPTCASLNRVPRDKLAGGGKCGRCHSILFGGHPVTLTAANFEAHATRSGIPLVIDFWASWCGPCRQMAPQFAAAAADLEPMVRLGKLDTEAEQAIAGRYGIRSIPTMALISEGREIARQSGAMPKSAIVGWVRKVLSAGG